MARQTGDHKNPFSLAFTFTPFEPPLSASDTNAVIGGCVAAPTPAGVEFASVLFAE